MKFDRFTRTDKEELIKSILSNPGLLEQFYDFMTLSKNQKEASSPRQGNLGRGNEHGVSLSDKIFKIKLRTSAQFK